MGDQDAIEAAHANRAPIFISYSRQDEATAKKLHHFLTGKGHEVWWDAMIAGGQRYAHIIEERLDAASAVIVLWSEHSLHSEWVLDEGAKGRDRGVLLPMSLDGSAPPLGFRQHQVIDARNARYADGDPVMDQLLKAIDLVQHGKVIPPPGVAVGQGRISRRQALIGGGVVALAAAGGFTLFGDRLFGPGAAERSIAILPFVNLSEDKSQAYLATGLAEELRNLLSQNPDILVAAQTSSAQASTDGGDARAIADRLRVGNVLEGSVRRAGSLVRVAVRLVEGKTGFEQWSDSFDRDFGDILELQREVSTRVADMLAINLVPEGDRGATGGTRFAEAFDAYLHGKDLYDQAIGEETDRPALAYFDEALAIDPDYAAAHAARARVLTVIANNYSSGSELAELYDAAIAAARRATEIAPNFATGHSALGFVLANAKLDIGGATSAYERSFETGFGNADILGGYANFAARIGRFDAAREAIARTKRLDPLNSGNLRIEALIELNSDNFDAARALIRNALSLNADQRSVHNFLGVMAYVEGDLAAAREAFDAEPAALSRLRGLAIVAHAEGKDEEAARHRAQLIAEYGDNSLYQLAQIDAQSDTPAQALDRLEAALAIGDSGLVQMRFDHLLDPVREDPRFKAIESRLGFPS